MNKETRDELIERFKSIEIGSEGFHSWGMTDWQAEQCAEIAKQEAIGFAEWIGVNNYTKHQINDRWYDSEDFLCNSEQLYTIYKNQKVMITDKFKIIGMSAPKSFTCQALDKEDIFWAKDGMTEGAYKKLFTWAKNDDTFWKQNIMAEIEFDGYGVNRSAINGKVISITIS